jgi:hypothetical protein
MASSAAASKRTPKPILYLEPSQTGELAGVVFRLSPAATRAAVILESTEPLTFDIDSGMLKFPNDPQEEPV